MELDLVQIRRIAREQIDEERKRAAIEAEKARLRAQPETSFWQRLANLLPFTITWRK